MSMNISRDLDFDCTMCGKCCHGLRVPLTVSEALAWLGRGHDVQILCEALPWPEEPAADNQQALHKRRRSFAVMSGSLPTRIVVILTGAFASPCPNLQPDMRCGIYDERPLVCRIYPAEISPFVELSPRDKSCPPEAWKPGLPPLMRGGTLVDATTAALIRQSRETDVQDVPAKQLLCEQLGIDTAAVSNEGFTVFSPRREDLLAVLRGIRSAPALPKARQRGWRYASRRRATVDVLASVGALGVHVEGDEDAAFEYVGFSAGEG
jgi:Fe-S-cluster containining protein